nr:MAG TPA: hypothetical protein [Caudoviricetes sp.]
MACLLHRRTASRRSFAVGGRAFRPTPSETFEPSAPRRQLSGGSITQTVRGYPRGCFDGLLPFVLQRFFV